MASCRRGYKSISVVPNDIPTEMSIFIKSLGADLMTVSGADPIRRSRDLAFELAEKGVGYYLDEYTHVDSLNAHYLTTAPEIWDDTDGKVTHFVSAAGSLATLMGVGAFLKEKDPNIQVIGVKSTEETYIPGITSLSNSYERSIYQPGLVDEWFEVSPELAANTTRKLSQDEGIFAGLSSGATVAIGSRLCRQAEERNIVCVICDRGDRYLSTGAYD